VTRDEFLSSVAPIIQNECWAATGDGAAGAWIKLELGAKIARFRVVSNPKLPEDVRKYEGANDVFVQCPWRVERGQYVLCGSADSSEPGGPRTRALRDALVGKKILSVRLDGVSPDLVVAFDNECLLRTFCDGSFVDGERYEYYSIRIAGVIYSVANDGISDETRREQST
jgi:hypothetical protein